MSVCMSRRLFSDASARGLWGALTAGDVVLLVSVTVMAAALTMVIQGDAVAERARWAVVEVADGLSDYALDREQVLEVEGPLGTTTLALEAGSARVVDSPCVNKICISTGTLDSPGQIAVCIPNRVLLRLVGRSEPAGIDAVTR